MRTFCIYIVDPISVLLAHRCLESGRRWGVDVELFDGVQAGEWDKLPLTFIDGANDGFKGCFSSHYKLWEMCADGDEHFVILEHDAVIQSPFYGLPTGDMLEICQPEKDWENVKSAYKVGKGGPHRGTTGYMVSPEQAGKFAYHAKKTTINNQVDIWMGGVVERKHAVIPYPVRCEHEQYSTIHTTSPLSHKRKIIRKVLL